MTRELKSLLCLDIDLERHSAIDHIFSPDWINALICEVPSLRFLLVKQGSIPAAAYLWRGPRVDSLLIDWNDLDVSGFRLSHELVGTEAQAKGRVIGAFLAKTAEHVRAAYRSATFETRLDIEGKPLRVSSTLIPTSCLIIRTPVPWTDPRSTE